MIFNVYTTGEDQKKEIYRLLNQIIKQPNKFFSDLFLWMSREKRFALLAKARPAGDCLKHMIKVYLDRGDQLFEKIKPEHFGNPYKAWEESYLTLKESLEKSSAPVDFSQLVLYFWVYKLKSTRDVFKHFIDSSLQEYCWEEFNKLRLTVPKPLLLNKTSQEKNREDRIKIPV